MSYACWAISNSYESAAYFRENLPESNGGWSEADLTPTSKYIINRYNDLTVEPEETDAPQPAEEEEADAEENVSESTDDGNVSEPVQSAGNSPVVPIVAAVVLVIAAVGAFVVMRGRKKQ